jgi:3-isopropylmalate/(R)-2-methylmalate dehydratase large subunit
LIVPECAQVTLRGALPKGVLGKDIYFRLLRDLKDGAQGRVLEYAGSGLGSLSIDVRMAVANGSNHLGAMTSIFPADQRLIEYLKSRAREPFEVVAADHDAHYAESYEYNLNEFEPLISGPDDRAVLRPLRDVQGTKVQAAIGSCSGGRFEDLALAAGSGRQKVHPGVRMVVTPISSGSCVRLQEGMLAIFTAAVQRLRPGLRRASPSQSPPRLDDEECLRVWRITRGAWAVKAKIYLETRSGGGRQWQGRSPTPQYL